MSLPTPYYQDDKAGITIYNADCREILPLLPKVDLVLTDPPYGMNFQSNHRWDKHDKIIGDDELPISLIKMAIEKAIRASYVFCRWNNLGEMPKMKSLIAWVKNNWSMGDLNHEHGRQWEACCFYPTEHHIFIKRIPDVILADRTGNDLHPTQKPVGVFRLLMEANVGDTILDPFMGSGSSLIAAKDLGRKAIGIEINRDYCDIAIKRLSQQVLPLSFEPTAQLNDDDHDPSLPLG